MEAGSRPPAPQQGSRRGLLWGLIVAVVVLTVIAAALLLWPSEEEPLIAVPDVVGLQQTEAEDAIAAAGLLLGEVEHVSVDGETTEAETVLSQLPRAGSEVESGSEVALVVSEAAEEASEEETEAPPSRSSGGSSAGGGSEPEVEPEAEADPEPEAEPETRRVFRVTPRLGGQGSGDHRSGAFTTTGSRLRLTVTLSTSSGASMFDFDLLNAAEGLGRRQTFPGTPTSTTHTREWSQPEGSYSLRISAPESGRWQFVLHELVGLD